MGPGLKVMENMQITTSVKTTKRHQLNGKAHQIHIYSWVDKMRPTVWCLMHMADQVQVLFPKEDTPWLVFQRQEKYISAQKNPQKLNMLVRGGSPSDVMPYPDSERV